MPKAGYAKRLKDALNKFDPKEAESVLDFLADAEDNGHDTTKEEENLRERLIKCLETYEKTMFFIER